MSIELENCVCLQGSKKLWTDLSIGNITKSNDLITFGLYVFLGFGYKITENCKFLPIMLAPPLFIILNWLFHQIQF